MSRNLPSIPTEKQQGLTTVSPLQLYLKEIARYPLLSPEDELAYAKKYFDEGDLDAAKHLVTANLRLVVKIANDFKQAQNNVLDLIQEGNYGLMQAVKKFNPYKGVKLSSYAAWWIRAYILKNIMDNKSLVKIGTTAAQRKLFYNLKKEADRLIAEYEHVDTKLLAAKLDVKEKEVVEMQMRLGSADVSLDAPFESEDSGQGGTLMNTITLENAVAVDEMISSRQLSTIFGEHLAEFAATLTGRDKDIFDTRLMSENPVTLQDIGNKYGITRERARQIEQRIVDNLRRFVKEKGIIDVEYE